MDRFSVVPAAYVVLRRGDEVLMLRRANTGYMDGYWAVPAGHVERGESVLEAAVREVREEVGVEIAPADLRPLTVFHRTQANGDPIDERVDFFFTASRWSGEPREMEPEKSAGLEWFALDKLPEPMVPHEARVLAGLDGELPVVMVQGFA
ncbi:NUDIX domain-containing protein [Kribbella sandramycini]|uniref:ADP-ribose pyrophosphatase YjhB (NUDIX family) n=1 Tax=Kribbella sandramycini TaxID=60450 RepID=A0A7Y4L3F9_9ACTN|nr:NUDIX domain-containing protein [Kribbella sandramycini]MBB6570528.1 ADP-ribose pyrophosphatase YjhB (NUDIX family) [Kribbella sandramycini]NOL43674.1 NUDIX domain-containing protein [Kribbella sandramycini]